MPYRTSGPRFAALLTAIVTTTMLPVQLTTAGPRHHGEASSRTEILAIAAKVADWQLSHLANVDYIPENQFRRDAEAPRDWVQAALYIGLAAFADTTHNARYKNAILAHGEAEAWGFDARLRHADADAIGAVWIWAAQRTHDPAKLGPIEARFDAVLADPSTVSLEFGSHDASCQDRWCWSDALFMAPPAWIALSKASGDERYLAHADQEFWATTNYLYDTGEHLFFRDSRYFTQRDAAGHKIFWSRGNGWVLAGLARILNELPKKHPSRPRYETLFKQMASRLLSLQGAEGYWPVSLLEPQKTPETSGTGFFVYGLAWGINHGLLSAKEYRQAADRGWHALTSAVSADGKLGWVQPIGAAPDRVGADDTQLYGVGALLLAASEMSVLP